MPLSSQSTDGAQLRLPRDARRHRRPGQEEAVPRGLPAALPVAARGADHRPGPAATGARTSCASTPARRSRRRARSGTRSSSTALMKKFSYVSGDYGDPTTFDRLKAAVGDAKHPIFHMAIPPSMFATVAGGPGRRWGSTWAAGSSSRSRSAATSTSALELNDTLHEHFDEEAIFRIDHFLGKEAMRSLLITRFANAILEPLWRRDARVEREDHHGRVVRRRGSRRVLRLGRRAARRDAEPPAADGGAVRHGAAGQRALEVAARREGQGAAGGAAGRPRALRARPVPRATGRSTAWRRTRTPRPSAPSGSTSTRPVGVACRSSCGPASRWPPR